MSDVSMSNTKKEILEAYDKALKKITDLESKLLNPEKKLEEKKEDNLKIQAKKIVEDNLDKTFSNLKNHLDSVLNDVLLKIEEQVKNYQTMSEAISFKEKELKEIYEIEKTSSTLAALIEAQNEKQVKFELDMAERRKILEMELSALKTSIEKEKTEYEQQIKSQKLQDKQDRDRQTEEFQYDFERIKLLAENDLKDKLAADKRKFDNDIEQKQKELEIRENNIKATETELAELRKKVTTFDSTLTAAVEKAKKETTEIVKLNLKHELELTAKQYIGEKEVLLTKIASLEEKVKEQNAMISSLSDKLESSYEKVQNVAVKAIEGASKSNYQGMKEVITERKEEK